MISLALLLLLQQTIQGVVMKADTEVPQPLPNARLELSGGGATRVLRTDSGGRFEFADLPAGRYRLKVNKDGFLRQEYSFSSLTEMRSLKLRLHPAPTIGGWVQDDDGEAAANVLVQALRWTYNPRGNRILAPVAETRTDDRGEFRLYWLDPGEYYVAATFAPDPFGVVNPNDPPVREAYGATYYPGSFDPNGADSVKLEIGREVNGVGFRLARVSATTVRGYVFSQRTGRAASALVNLTAQGDAPAVNRYRTSTNSQGSFEFRNVMPGSYVVSAQSTDGDLAFTRIDVRGRFVDVAMSLGPGFPVRGGIFLEPGTQIDLRDLRVGLMSLEAALPSVGPATVAADGTFVINRVYGGEYDLSVSGLPDDAYVKSALAGNIDALENGMTVIERRTEPLQVLLSASGGRLTGQVAASEATVVLVPDEKRRHRPDQYRSAVADEAGNFSFRGMTPGEYKVFAWKTIEPRAHLNADFMRRYEQFGLPVRISAGENPSVRLKVIED